MLNTIPAIEIKLLMRFRRCFWSRAWFYIKISFLIPGLFDLESSWDQSRFWSLLVLNNFVIIVDPCSFLVLGSIGPWLYWSMVVLVLAYFGPWLLWSMSILVDGNFGPRAFWSVVILVLGHCGLCPFWSISISVHSHFGPWQLWFMSILVHDHFGLWSF